MVTILFEVWLDFLFVRVSIKGIVPIHIHLLRNNRPKNAGLIKGSTGG